MNAFPLALTATGFTFLCTAVGAAFVFVVGHSRKKTVVQVSLGFAAGIMLAASVFGLLIPSIDGARAAGGGLTAPAGGFVLGVLLLMLMNRLVPHLHTNADEPEGVRSGLGRQSLLFLAITIHNVPEGMALGVLAAAAGGSVPEGMGALMALAIGIGIQNIPEGTAVSVPLFAAGGTRKKPFSWECFPARSNRQVPFSWSASRISLFPFCHGSCHSPRGPCSTWWWRNSFLSPMPWLAANRTGPQSPSSRDSSS